MMYQAFNVDDYTTRSSEIEIPAQWVHNRFQFPGYVGFNTSPGKHTLDTIEQQINVSSKRHSWQAT